MIVRFISFASPPWLMESPLDIHALKEMTLLLLLYPLKLLTLLFQGPPGTGKLCSQGTARQAVDRNVRSFHPINVHHSSHHPTSLLRAYRR